MDILSLPNELLLSIAENLAVKDLSHFVSACRHLSSLLTPRLHYFALQKVGQLTALQWAVSNGHAPLAELAISNGARVDERYPYYYKWAGRFPLHQAAKEDHPDVIRVLAKHGAQLGVRDNHMRTPLHCAAWYQSPGAIRALLELGADTTCIDNFGKSPAHIAASKGPIDCMKPFVDAGLDFSYKDQRGRTVLHDAVALGVPMMKYLLQSGGAGVINARDFQRQTPLHRAFISPGVTEEMVRLLLDHGANTEMKDNRGRTPVYLNCRFRNHMFTTMLLEARASPPHPDWTSEDEREIPLSELPD